MALNGFRQMGSLALIAHQEVSADLRTLPKWSSRESTCPLQLVVTHNSDQNRVEIVSDRALHRPTLNHR